MKAKCLKKSADLLSCCCQQKCRSQESCDKMDFFFNQARNSSSVSRKRHGRRWLSEKLNFSFILRQSSKFGGRRLELKGREEKRDAKGPFFIKRLWPKCSASFFYWKRLNCLEQLSQELSWNLESIFGFRFWVPAKTFFGEIWDKADFLSLKQTHKNWYLVKKPYFWNKPILFQRQLIFKPLKK